MAAKTSNSGTPSVLSMVVLGLLAFAPLLTAFVGPPAARHLGAWLGWYLRKKTDGRREQLADIVEADERAWAEAAEKKGRAGAGGGLSGGEKKKKPAEAEDVDDDGWEKVDEAYAVGTARNGEKADDEWDGIVGFFHPFCNAGGGGERVLWAAIRATQERWPKAKCVVYTGDHDVNKEEILARVETRFNMHLHPPTITFLYLTTRHWVLASTWPSFTLLGQSLGSAMVAWDAFSLLAPDVFVDTMGYAFALALSKLLFPRVPTGAYVHYPTISTDMLDSLGPSAAAGESDLPSPPGAFTDAAAAAASNSNSTAAPPPPSSAGQGLNAGQGAGLRGAAKKLYWQLFAALYARAGAAADVVMTNSSWTQAHMQQLWGPYRTRQQEERRRKKARQGRDDDAAITKEPIAVVYPPVAVRELEQQVDVSAASEKAAREKVVLYIAQFRPEKNHQLVLKAFAEFVKGRADWQAKKPPPPSSSAGDKDPATTTSPPAHHHRLDASTPRLVLLGSVRDDADSKRVYELRLLANELGVRDRVSFVPDAAWPEVLAWLRRASVGVNGMWNEHFGIGVVEYQAAGLIAVVHDSGGPKLDIVTEVDGLPTGYHATTASEFAAAFDRALSDPDPLAMRLRARASARRFTEEEFARKWTAQMEKLVAMAPTRRRR